MTLDPRNLRPTAFARLLNSTPLGTVMTGAQLHEMRTRAGYRIGDDKHVDLIRAAAYMADEVHGGDAPWGEEEGTGQSGYDAHRERAAQRNRKMSESGRNIGELPPVAEPERRAHAARDYRFFCETYLSRTFHLQWSADHLTVIARIEKTVLEGGLYAIAMPRGSGKSSMCEAGTLWAEINGHRIFVVPIGASEAHAIETLASIKTELETNPLLLEDYPEVCFVIRALEGIANRCAGQLYRGEQTRITWTEREIVLPTVRLPDTPEWQRWARPDGFSLSSGSVIRVAGITGRIRGMSAKRADGAMIRPDLALIDDPQTDESARSLSQCATRERVLAGAVLGMAGPGKKIAGLLPCTVIRPGDVADVILDREKHPEWNGERTKMLYAFPKQEKLWTRYAEVRAESLRIHGDIREATAYYEANRALMDDGAEVAWPERFNSDEISAVQHAMNLWIQDPTAFAAEYQNEPLPEAGVDDEGQLSLDQIAQKVNGRGRGEVALGVEHVVAFVDVQGKLLYWMVAGIGEEFTGYILDYGTYPDQKRAYFSLRDAQRTIQGVARGAGLEGAIYAALDALSGDLCERAWRRDDGAELKLERCLVDANWGTSTDVVYQFCRQSKHATVLLPAHGRFVGAGSTPFSEYRRHRGDRIGQNWRMPNVQGKRAVRHVLFDANYWKSFLHTRLAVAMGDPGCWSFFGRDPEAHRLLAEHITAEYRVRVEGRGRVVDEWKQKPNTENHWLDCAAGCAVAGSMQGARLAALDAGAAATSVIRLSEIRKAKRR